MSSIFEPRTVTVHVYVGDYHDRLAKLEREVLEAADSYDGRTAALDETPEHLELAQRYDDLAAEAPEHRVEVKLQALGRRQSKELRAKHPPREARTAIGVTDLQARGDLILGVNEETFKDALVRASVVEPAMTEDDFDNLSEGAFTALYAAALDLTYGVAEDPKAASLVSRLTRANSETSS